jgi:hypothetical protein
MDNNTKFHIHLGALEQFIKREGHSKIPAAHVEAFEEKQISLGAWAGYIRQRYRNGLLSQERVVKIQSIPGWQWGPFQPGPSTDTKRNEEIREMRIKGMSLREIADSFDLSRQRVHQIVKKLNI